MRSALFLALQRLHFSRQIAFGVVCFVAVALLRWPLFYVLFGLGSVACTTAYQKLKP